MFYNNKLMKSMSKLGFIQGIVNLSIGLMIAGAVFVVIFFSVLREGAMIDLEQPHWEIRSGALQEQLQASLPKPDEPVTLTVEVLEMQLPLHLGLRLAIIALMLVVFAYSIGILYTIRKVIIDVRAGNPFNLANTKRIKRIGLLVTAAPLTESALHAVFSFWIGSRYQLEGLSLATEANLGSPFFVLGLLPIVLGVAFEQGLRIKEENELTI